MDNLYHNTQSSCVNSLPQKPTYSLTKHNELTLFALIQMARLLGRIHGVVFQSMEAALCGSLIIGKVTIISGAGTSRVTPGKLDIIEMP